MPEGPFGFPRLTTVGPLVTEEKTDDELLNEIIAAGHSYRNYNPKAFIRLATTRKRKKRLRTQMSRMEGGRMNTMLKDIHRFFIQLDKDEMKTFADRNPGIIEWVDAWAEIEDQMKPTTLLNNNA